MNCDLSIGNGVGVVVATQVASSTQGVTRVLGLNNPHALGIVLHAENALILGVPYATHLENWIQTLPETPFDQVGDYARSFRHYLGDIISRTVPETEILRDYLWSWRQWLCELRDELDQEGLLTTEGITSFFEERADRFVNGERPTSKKLSTTVLKRLGQGSWRNVIETECRRQGGLGIERASIEGMIEEVFGVHLDERARRAMRTWAYLWLGAFHPATSGCRITFVGYGAKSVLPSCDADKIDGYAFGQLFFRSRGESTVRSVEQGGDYFLFEVIGKGEGIWPFIKAGGLSQVDSLSSSQSTANPANVAMTEEEEWANVIRAYSSLTRMNLVDMTSTATRLVGLSNVAQGTEEKGISPDSRVVTGVITQADGFRNVDPTYFRP